MHNDLHVDRRRALGTLGILGPAAILAGTASGQPEQDGRPLIDLGWNESKGEYSLPDLPYAYDALEPHIDQRTMRIHHDKHHAGYVKGLNSALAALAEARASGDASLVQHWTQKAAFHGSGHVNHTLFWLTMSPSGGGRPSGDLARAIDRDFGSFDQFSWQFQAAAKSVEGSGWGWLVFEPIARRLMVLQMENQQKLLMTGVMPLLGVDVWEHAYYLKYQNDRGSYVSAFMNLINWPFVQQHFAAAARR